jgi:hypothetical protein
VLRSFVSAGTLLAGGLALFLSVAPARAQDPCFAFFRRDPADAGARPAACSCFSRFCRPPRCPPYSDPTFGYYPTVWRAWPSLFAGDEAAAMTTTSPSATPAAPAPGETPRVMPPASDEAKRRSTFPGGSPSVTSIAR